MTEQRAGEFELGDLVEVPDHTGKLWRGTVIGAGDHISCRVGWLASEEAPSGDDRGVKLYNPNEHYVDAYKQNIPNRADYTRCHSWEKYRIRLVAKAKKDEPMTTRTNKYRIGDHIRLAKYDSDKGDTRSEHRWVLGMDAYVGREGKITGLLVDDKGISYKIAGNEYWWAEEGCELISKAEPVPQPRKFRVGDIVVLNSVESKEGGYENQAKWAHHVGKQVRLTTCYLHAHGTAFWSANTVEDDKDIGIGWREDCMTFISSDAEKIVKDAEAKKDAAPKKVFKVGDTVQLSAYEGGTGWGIWCDWMREYVGKTVKIIDVRTYGSKSEAYRVDLDMPVPYWDAKGMTLVPKEEPKPVQPPKHKFQAGDWVILKECRVWHRWVEALDPFIGKRVKLTKHDRADGWQADGIEDLYWSEEAIELAPVQTEEEKPVQAEAKKPIYKAGDMVILGGKWKGGRQTFIPQMEKYVGKQAKLVEQLVAGDEVYWRVDEQGGSWYWKADVLKPVPVEEKKETVVETKPKFEIGQEVLLTSAFSSGANGSSVSWNPQMIECVGKKAKIISPYKFNGVFFWTIKTESGITWTWLEEAMASTKYEPKVGDEVILKAFPGGRAGWAISMKDFVGQRVKLTEASADGKMWRVDSNSFWWNTEDGFDLALPIENKETSKHVWKVGDTVRLKEYSGINDGSYFTADMKPFVGKTVKLKAPWEGTKGWHIEGDGDAYCWNEAGFDLVEPAPELKPEPEVKKETDFEVGKFVILGEHVERKYWSSSMDKYVGKVARLKTKRVGWDPADRQAITWHVESNDWDWRQVNMTPVPIRKLQEAKLGDRVIAFLAEDRQSFSATPTTQTIELTVIGTGNKYGEAFHQLGWNDGSLAHLEFKNDSAYNAVLPNRDADFKHSTALGRFDWDCIIIPSDAKPEPEPKVEGKPAEPETKTEEQAVEQAIGSFVPIVLTIAAGVGAMLGRASEQAKAKQAKIAKARKIDRVLPPQEVLDELEPNEQDDEARTV